MTPRSFGDRAGPGEPAGSGDTTGVARVVARLRRRLDRSERGDTLIELLIAIVIIALTVTALLSGLVTAITSSATQKSLSTVDSVLNSFAQSAQYEAQQVFVNCTPTPYRLVSAPVPSSGPTGASATVFVTGLTASHGLSVTVGSTSATIIHGSTTDGKGDATVTFIVPNGLTGAQAVSVNDGTTLTSPTDFVVGGTTKGTTPVSYAVSVGPVQQWNAQTSTWVATSSGLCPNSGAQQITAYATGPNGSSGTLSFVVLHAATTTVLVTSSSPCTNLPSGTLILGCPLLFSATVVPPTATTPNPTGSIQWSFAQSPNNPTCSNGSNNVTSLSSVAGTNTSQATCSISAASVGTYQATAGYPPTGLTGNYGSGSGQVSITVGEANSSTTVTGSSSPSPAQPGSTLTFLATVGASPAVATDPQPTGTVTWSITSPTGPPPACSGTGGDTQHMTGNGTGTNAVTCTITLPNNAPTGAYSATATYAGDGNYNPAPTSSPATIGVSKATPTLTFATTGTPQPGSTFKVTVTVKGNGSITPTGTITWGVTGPPGSTAACGTNTSPLVAGAASCSVPLAANAPTGTYTVSATYSGDGAYNGANGSTPVAVAVPPAGFNIQTVGNPANNKPDSGDQIVYTYNQVMSAGSILAGWNGVAPASVTATFARQGGSPTSLTIGCTGFRCATPNLGTVTLGDAGGSHYVGSFGQGVTLNATMTLTTNAGNQSVVTITLNQSNNGISVVPGTTTLIWTPSNAATNVGGVACATTPVTEVGAPKANF